MGIYITHNAFDGAYWAFNRFRSFVCEAIGGSFPPHEDKTLLDDIWYYGEGYNRETHPGLYEFFSHSDCDGEISPEMCVVVANELESILPLVEDLATKHEVHGHILRDGGYVAVTKRFIEGCRKAAAENEPLVFG